MSNETKMEMIEEAVETGMEVATKAAKNNDWMKRVGLGFGYAAAGAVAYKGIEMLIDFGKSKFEKRKAKKDEEKQSETANEKTESVEN